METGFSENSHEASGPYIKHISDTALWVAMFRALESERPDALFSDPFARRLSGARGVEIMKRMPYPKLMAWVMSVRTVALDRLILRAIDDGCDTIVNMGAGLDSRPYRMSLPKNLRWVELDFPHVIQLKNRELKDETPVCQLERIGVDLSQREARKKIMDQINSGTQRFAVLTEGVIMYLTNHDVTELSEDLRSLSSLKFWIQDYRHGGYAQTLDKMKEALKDSPFQFVVENWFDFFRARGWEVEHNIVAWQEAKRLGRRFPFMTLNLFRFLFMRHQVRKQIRDSAGYVTFRPQKVNGSKTKAAVNGSVVSASDDSVNDRGSTSTSQALVEGKDFTIENGLYVFSSKYLSNRGYCCDSGCRNCPY